MSRCARGTAELVSDDDLQCQPCSRQTRVLLVMRLTETSSSQYYSSPGVANTALSRAIVDIEGPRLECCSSTKPTIFCRALQQLCLTGLWNN